MALNFALVDAVIAGSCSEMIPGTNEWDCFGAADSVNDTYKPLSAVTNPVSVTLDSTFELDTTRFSTTPNGWGIRITGNGVGNGIIISSEAGSIVTAGYEAVTVATSNSSLVLNWARSVAANVRDGFNLNTEDTGGAIISSQDIVVTGDITAGRIGILARNLGRGVQEVILGNILAGTTGTLIRNDGSNQLVVVNGNIQAGEYGLLMMHGVDNLGNETTGGSGTTHLLINGDVTTSNPAAEAVKLRAGLGTTDMDVNIAGDVNGDFGAVYIENRGSGSTLGEFTGHLQSQNGDALKVISGAQGTSLDIEVANTTGGNYGVSLTNNGTGPTSLTVLSGGVVQGSVARD